VAVFRVIPAGDLALENGSLVWLGRTPETRVQIIRQKIAARFRFFVGEWFLDQREGIPYYRDVLLKNPNTDLIRSLFLRVLRQTPGVLDVPSFSLEFDPSARRLSFAFEAKVSDGEVAVAPEDRDFVVDLATSA
jgi:hypothetical protein